MFDIQVSYPFSDVEAPEQAGGRTAHCNLEVHPNLLVILMFSGIALTFWMIKFEAIGFSEKEYIV